MHNIESIEDLDQCYVQRQHYPFIGAGVVILASASWILSDDYGYCLGDFVS